jgi:hypothetical protein
MSSSGARSSPTGDDPQHAPGCDGAHTNRQRCERVAAPTPQPCSSATTHGFVVRSKEARARSDRPSLSFAGELRQQVARKRTPYLVAYLGCALAFSLAILQDSGPSTGTALAVVIVFVAGLVGGAGAIIVELWLRRGLR